MKLDYERAASKRGTPFWWLLAGALVSASIAAAGVVLAFVAATAESRDGAMLGAVLAACGGTACVMCVRGIIDRHRHTDHREA